MRAFILLVGVILISTAAFAEQNEKTPCPKTFGEAREAGKGEQPTVQQDIKIQGSNVITDKK